MKSEILFIFLLVSLLALSFSTVGFSVTELDQRSTTVTVAKDDSKGVLSLIPGESSMVDINSEGALEISLANQLRLGGGVNPRSTLKIGDSTDSDPEAFRAVNAYNKDLTIQLDVQNIQTPKDQSGTNTGGILIYQNGNMYEATGESGVTIPEMTLSPGESASYSLHFDTPEGITTSDPYSAELSFQVTKAIDGIESEPVNNPSSQLNNPSFESMESWDFSSTGVQRSSPSEPSFDGSSSASMKDLTQSYDGRVLNSDPVSVTGGEYYDAEIYYKIQPPDGGTRDGNKDKYSVEIVWLDISGNEVSTEGVFGDFSETGSRWERVDFSEQAPSDAESAKLRIRAKEGGTNDPNVYWDSASLTEFSNQLSNPSFESTGSWDFSSTGVQRSSSSEPSNDGRFSASMKDLTQGYDGRVLVSDQVSVKGGDGYQFGADYRIQIPNGDRDSNIDRYSVKIVWVDDSGNKLSEDGFFGDLSSSTGSWNEVSSIEKAPSNAESAKLRIRAKEGGTNDPTVYWDSAFIKT